MSSSAPGILAVQSLVRELSVDRLSKFAQLSDLELREIAGSPASSEPKVYAHRMALILIAGPSIRLVFKAHFQSADAKALASKAYGKKPEEISSAQAADFIKEYCNLTAGAIKRTLTGKSVPCGISLPLVIRGFDEIYFPTVSGAWEIRGAEARVYCSIFMEVIDEKALSSLSADGGAESDGGGDGDVDFL